MQVSMEEQDFLGLVSVDNCSCHDGNCLLQDIENFHNFDHIAIVHLDEMKEQTNYSSDFVRNTDSDGALKNTVNFDPAYLASSIAELDLNSQHLASLVLAQLDCTAEFLVCYIAFLDSMETGNKKHN